MLAAGAAALGNLALAIFVLNVSSGERHIDYRIRHAYAVGDAQIDDPIPEEPPG